MSVLMFSGSGQFVFASMWGAGAGALSIIAAVGIINLRYLLQSAALAPWYAGLTRGVRLLLGFAVTDENFAVHVTAAFQNGWARSSTTFFTCTTTLPSWPGWVAALWGPSAANWSAT